MNGYIGNLSVLKGYLEKIIEQFQRKDYLESQRWGIDADDPRWQFNEVRAYATSRKERFRSDRLFKIRDGAIFDDCCSYRQQLKRRAFVLLKPSRMSPSSTWVGSMGEQATLRNWCDSLPSIWAGLPLYVYKIVMRESVRSFSFVGHRTSMNWVNL